jgi:hypothetical protein
MPWTEANQAVAEERIAAFAVEFNEAFEAWKNGLQTGQQGQWEAALQDVLRRWREYTETLRAQSDAAMANEGIMARLTATVDQLTEQRSVLAALQSEAGTRTEAAESVNPKVRASPYTNVLGLQRTFRQSTRQAIIIATVVFAVLALGALGFLVWRVYASGEVARPSYAMTGGARGRDFGVRG